MGRVLLLGAFGQGNPGDEALLRAFREGLAPHEVVAASSDPAATRRDHWCAAVPAHKPGTVLAALVRADALVVAGGTIFKTLHASTGRHPRSLLRRSRAAIAAAHALRRPVALVGVGAGALPDRAARRLAVASARAADLLILRDEESAAVLRRAGLGSAVSVGADAAWPVLDTAPRMVESEDRVVVALSFHAGGTHLADRLAVGLAPLLAQGIPVALQPWQVDGTAADDRALAARVAQQAGAGAEVLAPPRDLEEAQAQLARARLAVSLRFHGLVAAAAAGTPTVVVDHEPKLTGLARRLGQPTVAADQLELRLGRAVVDALARPVIPSPAVVAEQTALAREGFARVHVLLDRSTSGLAGAASSRRWSPGS